MSLKGGTRRPERKRGRRTNGVSHVWDELVELKGQRRIEQLSQVKLIQQEGKSERETHVDQLLIDIHDVRPLLLLDLLDPFGFDDGKRGVGV